MDTGQTAEGCGSRHGSGCQMRDKRLEQAAHIARDACCRPPSLVILDIGKPLV